LRDWRCERALVRLLRELAPDVVHTHSSKAGILGGGGVEGRRGRPGLKIVHTIHGWRSTSISRPGDAASMRPWSGRRPATDAIISWPTP